LSDGSPDGRARGAVTTAPGGVTVALRVIPKAGTDAVRGLAVDAHGRERVKVAVTAAPADGKANAAVVALLAGIWRVPKSTLTIASGAAARDKTVHVTGSPDLATRLDAWAKRLERPERSR